MARPSRRFIMDLEHLNATNASGCIACSQKFTLGDPVVFACGAWEGGQKVIHEREAVYDASSGGYIERKCLAARVAVPIK